MRAALSVAGETIAYQAVQGKADPVDVSVVWNDAQAQMPPKVSATAWGIEANFPAVPVKGDIVQRSGVRYRVMESGERDGTGGITLHLAATDRRPDV